MEVKIQTLTPLWTGDIEGRMDRIHETGIIGSLRWWYEAIVRGLGGRACDPTSDSKCCYDSKIFRPPERQLCPACYVFGATGWRRRFLVDVKDDQTKPLWMQENSMLNIRPPDRTRGWFLPPGRMGNMVLNFKGKEETLEIIASLLLFIERWGNLGAKPQLGYGVFRIINRDELREKARHYYWEKFGDNKIDRSYPDLRCFGFLRFNFQIQAVAWWTRVYGIERVASRVHPIVINHQTIPISPALKNEWRFNQWRGGYGDEKLVFGTLQWSEENKIKRVRSKVSASWAYPQADGWEVRSWVWLNKYDLAPNLWDLLRDKKGWENVIKNQGRIEIHPIGAWRDWTVEEVAQFIGGAK